MGSDSGKDNERPVHEVTITKDFWMQTTEVTQAQWKAVMGSNPATVKGDDRAVEGVNWEDCQEFSRRLDSMVGAQTGGRRFGLPTEAQWECACRAGSTGKWCCGDDPSQLGEYAWVEKNSSLEIPPVGQKKPNAWGLHDMHGYKMEWCEDWYGPYAATPQRDPTGPPSGYERVVRGGWLGWPAESVRSSCRSSFDPRLRTRFHGLRMALR